MRTYRLKLKPQAPWSTPWHADTLFAALAWQVVQRLGEGAIDSLLEAFLSGTPPFLLSDALPEGWFPCPLSTTLHPLPGANPKYKLPTWVTEEQFRTLIKERAPLLPQASWPEPLASSRTLHASIDRALGTSGGKGNLFETDEWYLRPADGKRASHLTVYIRTENFLDRLLDLFESLSQEGFGKKRSVGRGAFDVAGEPEACEWMDDLSGANGFVSLSHFAPAESDPTDGRWRLLVKYPKFSPGVPVPSPFKGRLLMFRPGSVFRVFDSLRPFYGRVFTSLVPGFPKSAHYALAFTVPLRWPEG